MVMKEMVRLILGGQSILAPPVGCATFTVHHSLGYHPTLISTTSATSRDPIDCVFAFGPAKQLRVIENSITVDWLGLDVSADRTFSAQQPFDHAGVLVVDLQH